jgi:hypothetical protein
MADGLLTGWKAIAEFMGLHINTCKKYRKKYSMPVYYLPGGTPASIPQQLQEWLIAFSELKAKRVS